MRGFTAITHPFATRPRLPKLSGEPFHPLQKTLNGSAVPLLSLWCCDAGSIQSRRDCANGSDALFPEFLNRACQGIREQAKG